jgi:oligopeptide/dipeptide ABC transporter ATP-binding protein
VSATALLEASDVVRQYRVRGGRGTVTAVREVSVSLSRGEAVGLVGESGCGKSTLARLLVGLEPMDGGTLRLDGAVVSTTNRADLDRLRRRVQIIFQDPYASLNPMFSVKRALSEVLSVRGIGDAAKREARVAELLDVVGLPSDAGNRRPRELSGGQRQRVVIARALAVEPEVILADEALSALDVSVQAQILNLFARLQDEFGLTYLFISHDLEVVQHLCSRILVMYFGRVVEAGSTRQVLTEPRHPYTRALIASVPSIDPRRREEGLRTAPGELPNPLSPPAGCHFHPRCPLVGPRCRTEVPALAGDTGSVVACHAVNGGTEQRPAQLSKE